MDLGKLSVVVLDDGGHPIAMKREEGSEFLRPDGRLVALPGGVIIRDVAGSIPGAVGVSGDVSGPDEICAVAGVEVAGLEADIGDRPEWRRP